MNFKDYFSFTRGEKRGSVVLLIIIVALIAANFSIDLLKSNHQSDFSEFENKINAFEKELESNSNNNEALVIELFEFNPNTISDEEWSKLGFKDWQIKTINNYKSKGAGWRTKADVSKIYGLEETHFEKLKPFILLPNVVDKKDKYASKKEETKAEYFMFNPNTISKIEWKKLGFKDWQIKTIFNYKSKGGSWRTKTDIKNIYGLNEGDYSKLEPYILLPEKVQKKEYSNNKKDYTKKVNINTADAKELTNLKGIHSEKYGAIIIKYRDELGGFNKKEQLLEVWNMKEETYNDFVNQIIIGDYEPPKININTSSAKELKAHPYVDWKTANAIFKYRKANGNYKKVKDLKKIHLINNETYLKITPYLTVN
jgi:competence protein ComEA